MWTVLALWTVSLSKPRWEQERVPYLAGESSFAHLVPLVLKFAFLSASCLQGKQALIRLMQASCPLNNYLSN